MIKSHELERNEFEVFVVYLPEVTKITKCFGHCNRFSDADSE
jgi:hypothetical protein